VKIVEIVWLPHIVDKCVGKHNVWPDEVEEVFDNRPFIHFAAEGHTPGEDLYAAFGQADSGRFLVVFFVYKGMGVALIVSARPMTPTERKRYEKE
jgi:hypothetical protein